MLGPQPFDVLREHYARCRALVFPGEEDFGIVPVEAMASGRPVIAFGRGGVLDSVEDGRTGILFAEQGVGSLIAAVQRFEQTADRFDPEMLVAHARRFDRSHFRTRIAGLIEEKLAAHGARAKSALPALDL
jgi:glycosyltransferase involved in cell wall biosynthesis